MYGAFNLFKISLPISVLFCYDDISITSQTIILAFPTVV